MIYIKIFNKNIIHFLIYNLYFKIITEKQNIDFNKNVTKCTLFSQSVIKFALYCRFEHIRVNKLEFSIDFKDFRKMV